MLLGKEAETNKMHSMLYGERGYGKINRKGKRGEDNASPNDRVLYYFEILTLLLYQTRGYSAAE